MKITNRHIIYKFCSVLIVVCTLLIVSCNGSNNGIIPRKQMEEILFDYHLTQGVLDTQPLEDRAHNQRYLDAVFAKHGVTEEQFDSSMIYYTREGTMLKEMYADLNERFKDIEETLKLQAGNDDILLGLTASGDTANIWTSGSTILLRPTPLLNKETFTIRNDSTLFLYKDHIRLVANCTFFKEVAEDRSSSIEVGITLEYESGKTTGINRFINSTSSTELNIEATEPDKIKALHGFFYYSGSQTARNLAFLTNIAIIRMHDKTAVLPVEEPEPVDTLTTDSLQTDSTEATSPRERKHLTPEQLLQQSRTKERIEIKAAPDVRTKNTYGPKRKKASSKTNSRK